MRAETRNQISIHTTSQEQEDLQMAADMVGAEIREFVVQAALEKAKQVIAAESPLVLTRRESLRLLELIENPPPRNERFLQAQARYQKLITAA